MFHILLYTRTCYVKYGILLGSQPGSFSSFFCNHGIQYRKRRFIFALLLLQCSQPQTAIVTLGGKFQQTFIIRLCKIIVALPHIDIGTHQQGFLIIAFYIQHQRIVYPGQIILPQLKVKSGTIHQGRYGTRSNVQCQSIRVKGLLIPVLPTLYRTQVGEQQSVMRIGGLHFQSLFNVFFGQ